MSNDPFAPYRANIVAIDLAHLALIMVTIILIITVSVLADVLGQPVLLWYVPLLTTTMLGLIARLDTMVQRLGGFLKAMGDPWELAKAGHLPTRYLMPIADVLCMAIVLPILINAEYQMWHYYQTEASRRLYLCLTLLGVIAGIAGWLLAATKAKSGFLALKPPVQNS